MKMRFAVSALFTFASLVVGCECSTPPPGRSCDTTDDCRRGELCLDGECSQGTDGALPMGDAGERPDTGPPRTITALRLEPATADLLAADGARPTQTFLPIVTYSDSTEGPAFGPSFAIDTVSIGDLDVASGVFTANGVIGGTATITCTVPNPAGGDLVATAGLVVRLQRTLIATGAPTDAPALFAAATAVDDLPRSAGLVYPLDGVVMPQNVYPADVQWTVGAAGDLFRVTMTKPSATVTAYVAYDGLNHWLADGDAWRAIAQTNPDEPATLGVDRLEASTGQVVRGAPISMTFARAALTGSVYYWDIEAGRIQRIDDGSGTAVSFMPTPPVDAGGVDRCVGCHSVSPSGRYMAGRLGGGDNIGGIFDLTTDLSGNPPPTVYPLDSTSIRWWFSSWSPDETRLVVTFSDPAELRVYDPFAGTRVTMTGAMPTSATHPAWSPDGTRIAYVANANAWGGGFTAGDIAILPVTAADTVGAPAIIHSGAALPGGVADSYPTWTPDSMHIAFGHGNGCRSEDSSASLYIMSADGSGVAPLTRASATEPLDYQPRFSPVIEGGYYWMSFLSRRVYGNPAIGNGPRVASRRQQIWVAAIRVGAAAGEDPSAVPYWLPGQNTRSANISAYWAPRACRTDGEGCSVGSECCGGDCRPPSAGGAPVCSPPPPDRCRASGETCGSDGDCCPDLGLTCLGHVCVAGPG